MHDLGRQHLGTSLAARGWAFQFDRAKRRLGSCQWKKDGTGKVITLSKHFSVLNGWSVMEDVARHEIAHALDYETRGRSDHGPAWRRWARLCGADPTRLYEGDDVVRVTESKYVGICPSCGKEHPYHRRLRRAHACADCCRRHAGGRYDARFRLRLVERASGREVRP